MERAESKTEVFETTSEEETYKLGERLGTQAQPGQVYTLIGDLGVGKTVFTKGFAKGLGITDHVSSPTFTILTWTASVMWRRWRKSAMRTAFLAEVSA